MAKKLPIKTSYPPPDSDEGDLTSAFKKVTTRWRELDKSDKRGQYFGSEFGIFFTPMELKALCKLIKESK